MDRKAMTDRIRALMDPSIDGYSSMIDRLLGKLTDDQVRETLMEMEDCDSCGEGFDEECPESKRPCGHHCNCSWTQDQCCWCGKEWGEEDDPVLHGKAAKSGAEASKRAMKRMKEEGEI